MAGPEDHGPRSATRLRSGSTAAVSCPRRDGRERGRSLPRLPPGRKGRGKWPLSAAAEPSVREAERGTLSSSYFTRPAPGGTIRACSESGCCRSWISKDHWAYPSLTRPGLTRDQLLDPFPPRVPRLRSRLPGAARRRDGDHAADRRGAQVAGREPLRGADGRALGDRRAPSAVPAHDGRARLRCVRFRGRRCVAAPGCATLPRLAADARGATARGRRPWRC